MNKMEKIRVRNHPSFSIIVSMLAGVFIITAGLSLLVLLSWFDSSSGMDGVWHFFMGIYPRWLIRVMISVSLSSGTAVISATYKMYKEPENKRMWGSVIVIGSIIGLFSGGPLGIGAVLGIISCLASLKN